MQTIAEETVEHRLTLPEIVKALVEDGLVTQEAAEPLLADRRLQRADHHPLIVIADQKWKSARDPTKPLILDTLTEWLADRVGLPYFHIDPLKINVSAVTEVVSNAYATRFKILPVGITPKEAVIATAEPYIKEYEKELKQILKLDIKRVVANPADIARYVSEFYNLARSIKKAAGTGKGQGTLGNFEQLVEMGKGAKQFDANDAHIVNIVDWLWQYAIEQRASDIHIEPRREIGIIRFRIDGVLHQVYQIPMVVMTAMTSRIKLLGRMDVIEKRRPQDGRIKTKTAEGMEVELRLSTLPTAFGEKLVMRILRHWVFRMRITSAGWA
jgi:general secretion pathway protein E